MKLKIDDIWNHFLSVILPFHENISMKLLKKKSMRCAKTFDPPPLDMSEKNDKLGTLKTIFDICWFSWNVTIVITAAISLYRASWIAATIFHFLLF